MQAVSLNRYPQIPAIKPQIDLYKIPESAQAKSFHNVVNVMTAGSYSVVGLSSIVLFFSPLVSKNAPKLLKHWEALRKIIPQLPVSSKIAKHIENKETLGKRAYQVGTFAFLFSSIQEMQTAYHAKQPSMMSSAIITTVADIITIFSQAPLYRMLYWPSLILFAAGKRQDIANSNDQASRREWHFFSFADHSNTPPQQIVISQSIASFVRYIAEDLRRIYSIQPWRDLKQNITHRKTTDWLEPKPAFSSLAGQLYTLGGISASLLFLPALFKSHKSYELLQAFNKTSSTFGELIANIPIGARAYQNKTEADGILTLMGIPLRIIGRAFMTDQRLYLLAILHLGYMLRAKGINMNTMERLKAVNYLKMLHTFAIQNPDLTARDVLRDYSQNPSKVLRLKKQVGTREFNFILNTLKQADQAQQARNVSFSEFLHSVVTPKSQ